MLLNFTTLRDFSEAQQSKHRTQFSAQTANFREKLA